MKYVRFQSLQPCLGTPSRLGIFQIAFQVRDDADTRVEDGRELARHLSWLNTHLRSPDLNDRDYRAIFWFKDTARAPMARLWAIKACLDSYGHWIELVKTRRPGQIIYEDGWQVAAKPWRRRA